MCNFPLICDLQFAVIDNRRVFLQNIEIVKLKTKKILLLLINNMLKK